MDPEEISTENKLLQNIRQKNRDDVHKSQHNKRLSTVDRQRCGLTEISATIREEEQLTEKDVQGLSSRIKRRKGATTTDLKRLSAAFLHNSKNIETFSKIPGALNVVVKELSGSDMEKQVLACECLCNLALGEDVCSKKVAQAAGSYLALYLDGVSNKVLVETCLWAIQNLVLSGGSTRKILVAQGLHEKLVSLLQGTKDTKIAHVTEETFAILVVEAWEDFPDEFKPRALLLLVLRLSNQSLPIFYALYTLLMHLNFKVDAEILVNVVTFSEKTLMAVTQSGRIDPGDFSRCLMSIRIITNALLGMERVPNDLEWCHIVNTLMCVDNEQIAHEALWMVATLSKVSQGLLEPNLKIPTKYL